MARKQKTPEELAQERAIRRARAIRTFSSWGNQSRLLSSERVEGWSDDGQRQLDLFRQPTVEFTSVASTYTGTRNGRSWVNGLLHREDGPAILDDAHGIARFALNGYTLTWDHFCRLLELTDEETQNIILQCNDYRPV